VTYSAGAGWATAQVGPAPAESDHAVTNLSGSTIYPTLPTTATMKIGWNLTSMPPQTSTYFYQNILNVTEVLISYSSGSVAPSYPTIIGSTSGYVGVSSTQTSHGADRKNWANVPPGDYILMWDGASNCELFCSGGGVATEYTDRAVYPNTGNLNNTRVYSLQGDAFHYGPEVSVLFHATTPVGDGTYLCDFSNLRIYPADTNLASPPKYRTDFLAKYQGVQSGRNLDPTGAIEQNPTDFNDFNPPQDIPGKNVMVRHLTPGIAEIRPYTGTDYVFDGSNGIAFLVTTSTPHGFSPLQYITFRSYSGPPPLLSDGSTLSLNDLPGFVYYLTDTTFVFFQGPRGGLTMTNVITNPPGYIEMKAGTGFPLQDIVEIHNLANMDLYFNTAFCTTDACLTALGTYFAAHLNPGLQLLHEVSNETWNFGVSPYALASNASFVFYGGSSTDETAFTCEMSNHQWNVMKAAWVAAGRPAGDFVRVLGTNHDNTGTTQRRAAYCHSRGIMFDALAGAPYMSNNPSTGRTETAFAGVIDLMTPDQHLDMWEAHWTYGGYQYEIPGHLSILTDISSDFAEVEYIGYEGGPGYPLLAGGTAIPSNGAVLINVGPKGHAVWRHPRYYGILLHIFRLYQDSGLERLHIFEVSGTDSQDSVGWPAYVGSAEAAYVPGDAAQDAIQINSFDRLDLIRSITGGAVQSWGSLFSQNSPTPPPPPPPTPPTSPGPKRFLPFQRPRSIR
jgi:hypothetical protein